MIHLCIVVPMYNEQKIAVNNLATILDYARKLPCETAVLVVDDGSTDNTKELVSGLVRKQPDHLLHLVAHECNQGYGAANRTGIQYAIARGYDYVLFMDSDLTNHPRFLKYFYTKMEEGWDYIKATRYEKGGSAHGVPRKRRIISRLGNILARHVTHLPLTDVTNGFRAVKTEVLRKIELREDHFALIVEEVMKARKYTKKICEIPSVLGARSTDARPTKFSYDVATFWKYFKYLFV